MNEFIKSLTIKDCVYMAADSWNGVKKETFERCWQKLWPREFVCESFVENSNETEILEMIQQLNVDEYDQNDVKEWLESDSDNPGFQTFDDNEIVSQVKDDQLEEAASNDNITSVPTKIPTHSEALNAFETAIKWLECQKESDHMNLMYLRKLRDLAAKKRANNIVQLKLTHFLKHADQ
jgi:hypothetical protein